MPCCGPAPAAILSGSNHMLAYLERILDSSMLSPHGICLLWEPD
ncbi:hypothetical protein ABIF50_007746 [Bradyrhizobium diazoefficiens]